MTTETEQFTVAHDGVTIAVTRGGVGRPLVLCPGLSSTQADLLELAMTLRREFDVVTFDLRGHGLSAAADEYHFAAFQGDLAAVLTELQRRGMPTPILAGHSYGADLIAHHVFRYPGAAKELVLIDGANPLPAPFITESDLPEFRAMWDFGAQQQRALLNSSHRVLLTGQQMLELNLELDILRSGLDFTCTKFGPGLLGLYRGIHVPVRMIVSTSMAGDGVRAARYNELWRSGIERLLRADPGITVDRVDAGHDLVISHAHEVAGLISQAGAQTRRV